MHSVPECPPTAELFLLRGVLADESNGYNDCPPELRMMGDLLCGHPQGRVLDIGKAPGKALAFRIHKRRRARARNSIDRAGERNLTCQRGPDQAMLDGTIIGDPARMGVAVSLDQPCALGDLECQFRRQTDGVADQGEPGVDLPLFLLVAIAMRT